jgi:TPR repeat protein
MALLRLPSTSSPAPASSPSPVSQPPLSPSPSGAEGLTAPASPVPVLAAVASNSPTPTPSGAELFVEAKRYLDAMDDAKALPLLQRAAEAGNAEAMRELGYLYKDGDGVTQDRAQARSWFKNASDAGDLQAKAALEIDELDDGQDRHRHATRRRTR